MIKTGIWKQIVRVRKERTCLNELGVAGWGEVGSQEWQMLYIAVRALG